ncbi:uncharacterized protein DS421_13g423760 [Arachis hypogaea]|nr:uncharacterized protein DS421_13g423760 [Arachis hypogaea]
MIFFFKYWCLECFIELWNRQKRWPIRRFRVAQHAASVLTCRPCKRQEVRGNHTYKRQPYILISTLLHARGNHTYLAQQVKVSSFKQHAGHVSPSKQHAGCELTTLHHVSAIQAAHKLRVSVASPFVKHAVTRRLRVAPCLHARDRPLRKQASFIVGGWGLVAPVYKSDGANRNFLPRKLDQPETWHSEIEQALRTTGFYQLSRVRMIRRHSAMLVVLVERSLCRASRYNCKEMDDPLDLLFAWAWERMRWLAPILRHQLAPAEIPMESSSTAPKMVRYDSASIRHAIDFMEERSYVGIIIPADLHAHIDVCDTQYKPYRLTRIAILFVEYSTMTGAGFKTNGYNNGITATTVVYEIEVYNQLSTSPCLPIPGVSTLDHTGCT